MSDYITPVMYVDPNGDSFILVMGIGFLVGAVLGAGFEIASQISSNGSDISSWDWGQIGLSALGGGVAGAISAIGLSSYSLTAYAVSMFTGGTGSVIGGWISGSVTDISSAMMAFGIGAVAGGLAKGVGHLRFNIKASNMLKATGKARSLAINNFLKTNNFSPVNMGHSSFGGWSRNIFKGATNKSIIDLVSAVTARSSAVYSSITSSLMSGWY